MLVEISGFHQGIKVMDEAYKGWWNIIMIGDYYDFIENNKMHGILEKAIYERKIQIQKISV